MQSVSIAVGYQAASSNLLRTITDIRRTPTISRHHPSVYSSNGSLSRFRATVNRLIVGSPGRVEAGAATPRSPPDANKCSAEAAYFPGLSEMPTAQIQMLPVSHRSSMVTWSSILTFFRGGSGEPPCEACARDRVECVLTASKRGGRRVRRNVSDCSLRCPTCPLFPLLTQ